MLLPSLPHYCAAFADDDSKLSLLDVPVVEDRKEKWPNPMIATTTTMLAIAAAHVVLQCSTNDTIAKTKINGKTIKAVIMGF